MLLKPAPPRAHADGDPVARRPPQQAVGRPLAETPLREALPELARVLAARERPVRVQDRVPSLDDVGVARLPGRDVSFLGLLEPTSLSSKLD